MASSLENLANKRMGYSSFSFRRNQTSDRKLPEQQAELIKHADQSVAKAFSMLINKDEDDQMEICGYKRSAAKTALTYVFVILTAGLLRLIFHWCPHWFLKAKCNPCDITQADFVLITEWYNDKHKIFHVKPLTLLTLDKIKKKQKDDEKYCDSDEDVSNFSVHFADGVFTEVESLLTFTCKKVTYIWDHSKLEFIKLKGLDQGVSSETLHGNRGLSKSEQYMRRMVYGANEIVVKESTILTLLFLEVLNPFYIFQIFSFVLWFADNYYYYAAAILLMSVFGISMTVIQTRRNQRNLKSTVHSSDVATVLRRDPNDSEFKSLNETKVEIISTELLVPGDILEIPQHGCIMQCDALLLTGNCILNESMLTGESVPVTKTPFPNLPDVYYDEKEHARHTLFCGTQVIQTRYFGNEKVLAVVLKTGFYTAKGGLVRSILYPPPVDFRFEKDSYRFVALLAMIAGLGFIYTIITKVQRGVPIGDLILEALDLITIVVPPALPAAMTVGRLYAQTRLQKKQIFCISPRSINVSGSIDCVCFDKTGTLTEDGLDLHCVVPISQRQFETEVKEVDALPRNTFVCGLVSCHSLTVIDKQISGDPLDLKMFESTKWSIEDLEVSDNTKFNMIFPTVFTPPKDAGAVEGEEIGVIREFPFSSSAQRMGVIIRKLNSQHFEYYSKGSPEMILNFVEKSSVPENFSEVLEKYTQEGYRVIALAHKELKLTYTKAQRVQRETIEHGMTLLGLIVLENRLKTDTAPCIQNLNEAQIRVIMVTGDNILTAISVARDCGIIRQGQSVITVNSDGGNPSQIYYTLTNTKNGKLNEASLLSNSSSIVSLDTVESQIAANNHNQNHPPLPFNNYRFAMTGKVWAAIRDEHPELIPKLVTRGSIFARMSPEQKQQLVQELQGLGYYVAMCGDGANDCGALKAAHTGISLSEAESSVASPFTSKNPNITCVLSIVKEGRAALVTSFGIFKYMAAYSLCQFISVMILYSIDSNLTDIEFLYIDLFIISIFAFFFGRTEAYKGKLVKETPLNSLMSFSPILSLFLQLVLLVFFQVLSFQHLVSTDWYEPFNATAKENKDLVGCVENYTIFTMSGFQYIILAIVFSKGKPYRQSIFSNFGLIGSAIALAIFSVYLALDPCEFLREQFELVVPEDFNFRLYLLAYGAIHFVLSILIEVFFVEHCVFKKLRYKYHNVYKSKRKFLAIEKDLSEDTKWPTLTSNYRSAASPSTPLPSCTAEIVFENKKFDKNHVLNGFYQQQDTPSSAPNSTKSTPSYNPNRNKLRNLENGFDFDQFQSAVSIMASDASFLTAEQSTPQHIVIDAAYPNHLQESPPTSKRIRSISSNSTDPTLLNDVYTITNGDILNGLKPNYEMAEFETS
ncbi:PREDICTED: probable cation-transporting ATPase 13A3 [Nicrophorus vespilloides]|uniref:Cation-transporting ATPase n=1 Tax=Nicrophorus vespilloides TaxID=110193 RepID=A0ABM1N1E1_NICVS|nr:PREDICTED: probable cation-transporting ATPase 13A3 [Nicrophorus vespilloides]